MPENLLKPEKGIPQLARAKKKLEGDKSVKLGDIANIYSGGTPSRSTSSYWEGGIPWVKTTLIQNCHINKIDIDEFITRDGLKNSSAKLVPKHSILLAMIGQGKTRGQVAILNTESATNQNAAAIVVNEDHDATYVFQQLLFRYKQIRNLSNSSGQQNLNLDIIKSIKLPKVTLVSQVYSANTLAVWDKAIEKTEALIAAKEKKFAWLTSNLINRANHDRHTASKYMSEVSTRNKGNKIVRVLSVTNHSGFVLPEERFKRRVASANVSNYKVIEKGQYAYNPSRINVGSIARLDNWNSGILSPMYVVFNIDRSQVRSDYFLHWLKSCETRQRIKNSAQGSVRETVSFKDLGAIDIPLPSMDLQKEIAYSLNAAQNEITLLKKILNKYHHQKRGLMQKLLTGEWQVNVNTKQPEETLKEVSA